MENERCPLEKYTAYLEQTKSPFMQARRAYMNSAEMTENLFNAECDSSATDLTESNLRYLDFGEMIAWKRCIMDILLLDDFNLVFTKLNGLFQQSKITQQPTNIDNDVVAALCVFAKSILTMQQSLLFNTLLRTNLSTEQFRTVVANLKQTEEDEAFATKLSTFLAQYLTMTANVHPTDPTYFLTRMPTEVYALRVFKSIVNKLDVVMNDYNAKAHGIISLSKQMSKKFKDHYAVFDVFVQSIIHSLCLYGGHIARITFDRVHGISTNEKSQPETVYKKFVILYVFFILETIAQRPIFEYRNQHEAFDTSFNTNILSELDITKRWFGDKTDTTTVPEYVSRHALMKCLIKTMINLIGMLVMTTTTEDQHSSWTKHVRNMQFRLMPLLEKHPSLKIKLHVTLQALRDRFEQTTAVIPAKRVAPEVNTFRNIFTDEDGTYLQLDKDDCTDAARFNVLEKIPNLVNAFAQYHDKIHIMAKGDITKGDVLTVFAPSSYPVYEENIVSARTTYRYVLSRPAVVKSCLHDEFPIDVLVKGTYVWQSVDKRSTLLHLAAESHFLGHANEKVRNYNAIVHSSGVVYATENIHQGEEIIVRRKSKRFWTCNIPNMLLFSVQFRVYDLNSRNGINAGNVSKFTQEKISYALHGVPTVELKSNHIPSPLVIGQNNEMIPDITNKMSGTTFQKYTVEIPWISTLQQPLTCFPAMFYREYLQIFLEETCNVATNGVAKDTKTLVTTKCLERRFVLKHFPTLRYLDTQLFPCAGSYGAKNWPLISPMLWTKVLVAFFERTDELLVNRVFTSRVPTSVEKVANSARVTWNTTYKHILTSWLALFNEMLTHMKLIDEVGEVTLTRPPMREQTQFIKLTHALITHHSRAWLNVADSEPITGTSGETSQFLQKPPTSLRYFNPTSHYKLIYHSEMNAKKLVGGLQMARMPLDMPYFPSLRTQETVDDVNVNFTETCRRFGCDCFAIRNFRSSCMCAHRNAITVVTQDDHIDKLTLSREKKEQEHTVNELVYAMLGALPNTHLPDFLLAIVNPPAVAKKTRLEEINKYLEHQRQNVNQQAAAAADAYLAF